LKSEEIKPTTLVVIELCLSEGVSQSVEKSVYLKFHSNLMQKFRVNLKEFLGLAMPNQCCHAFRKQIFSRFVGGIF